MAALLFLLALGAFLLVAFGALSGALLAGILAVA